MSSKKVIKTPHAPDPVGPYNQAILAGEWLFCSGQIALDPCTGEMVGDGDVEKEKHVEDLIKNNFDLSPRGIREMLNLNKPIYEKTAAYGHFGRAPDDNGSFSWEKTDKLGFFSK